MTIDQLAGDVDRRPGHDISIQRSIRTRPGRLGSSGIALSPPPHLHGRLMSMDVILDEVCRSILKNNAVDAGV